MNRDDLDKIAWQTIHARVPCPGLPPGLARCGRPANFQELGELFKHSEDFEQSWSEFLHEFFRYKTASFFKVPPSEVFTRDLRAMMAGVAEFLCAEFQLAAPHWVNDPQFTTPELTEPWGWMYVDDDPGARERRIQRTDPLILKHNIIFETRNLITL